MRIGRETRPADESGLEPRHVPLGRRRGVEHGLGVEAERVEPFCELVHERDVHVAIDVLDTLCGRRCRRGLDDANRVVHPIEQRCNGPRRRRLRGCHELRPPPTHLARRARRKSDRRQSDGELPRPASNPDAAASDGVNCSCVAPGGTVDSRTTIVSGVSRPPIVSAAARTAANPSPPPLLRASPVAVELSVLRRGRFVVVVRWNRDEHRVGVADAVRIRGERAVAGSDVIVADHAGRVDASAVGRNGGFVDIVPGDVDPDPIE